METVADVVLLKGNPVEVVVDVPKLNPPVVVTARENPVVGVVVVPVFEASNDSTGVADVTAVLLGRLKLGRLGADVVVAIVLPRPNPVPVVMAFGVPKVKPVDPWGYNTYMSTSPSHCKEANNFVMPENRMYLP